MLARWQAARRWPLLRRRGLLATPSPGFLLGPGLLPADLRELLPAVLPVTGLALGFGEIPAAFASARSPEGQRRADVVGRLVVARLAAVERAPVDGAGPAALLPATGGLASLAADRLLSMLSADHFLTSLAADRLLSLLATDWSLSLLAGSRLPAVLTADGSLGLLARSPLPPSGLLPCPPRLLSSLSRLLSPLSRLLSPLSRLLSPLSRRLSPLSRLLSSLSRLLVALPGPAWSLADLLAFPLPSASPAGRPVLANPLPVGLPWLVHTLAPSSLASLWLSVLWRPLALVVSVMSHGKRSLRPRSVFDGGDG